MTFQDKLRLTIMAYAKANNTPVDDIIAELVKTAIELLITSGGVTNAKCCLMAALNVVTKMESLNVKSLDTEPYGNA